MIHTNPGVFFLHNSGIGLPRKKLLKTNACNRGLAFNNGEQNGKGNGKGNGRGNGKGRVGFKAMNNVYLRVLSGVFAFAVLLGLFMYASMQALGWCFAAIGLFACREIGAMARQSNTPCTPWWLLVGGGSLAGVGAVLGGEHGLLLAITLSVIGMLVQAWLKNTVHKNSRLPGLGLGISGLMLGGALPAYSVLLMQLPQGRMVLLFVVFLVSANDTCAYAGGKLLGRTPLALHISPKKTVEGLAFGLLSGGIGGGVFALWLIHIQQPLAPPLWSLVVAGVMVSMLAQAGDLLISALKRYLKAKDSGFFLPGHGGLLDRLDAYLLALPVLYFVWYWYVSYA